MLKFSEIFFLKESKESNGIFERIYPFVEMESSKLINY
jgi:hypothetical protein